MAFAGVSLVGGDGKLCTFTVSPIDCRAASGYHLLVVEGFSRTRDILPAGEYIRCHTFLVGGHRWHLEYYPNGYDSEYAGFVSLRLVREEDDDDDEDENNEDWEANEDDQTDNDDEDEDDDYEDEGIYQVVHYNNDETQFNDMAEDDDDDEDDDCEDENHEDEHYNNDEAHVNDMAEDKDDAEDNDCEDEDHEDEHNDIYEALDDDMVEDNDHDYHELVPSVKAQVFVCFIDQFQWLHSGRMRETIIKDFGLETELVYGGIITREMLERSTHLKGDSFTIRCDIVVLDVKSKQGPSSMAPPFIQVPPSDMPIHFKDLLLSGEGADVTFLVGGETFAAHRCILAARSTVFKSQLFNDDLGAAVVMIDDIEAQVFEGMLTFIYTDALPDWNKIGIVLQDEAPQVGHVSVHYVTLLLRLLEAAERYDLLRLKLICQEMLVSCICLDTVADIIVGAERGRCPWLKENCLEFIKSHTNLHEVFTAEGFETMTRTCNPSGLKELISKFAS